MCCSVSALGEKREKFHGNQGSRGNALSLFLSLSPDDISHWISLPILHHLRKGRILLKWVLHSSSPFFSEVRFPHFISSSSSLQSHDPLPFAPPFPIHDDIYSCRDITLPPPFPERIQCPLIADIPQSFIQSFPSLITPFYSSPYFFRWAVALLVFVFFSTRPTSKFTVRSNLHA